MGRRAASRHSRGTCAVSYGRLANVYDFLMADVPYEEWLQFVISKQKQFQVEGQRVLDLACGTGELSIRLAKSGFEVTGVDLSGEMLAVAHEKAVQENVALALYEQDMSALEGLGTYEFITIFCDSLNYLSTPNEVKKTFQNVHQHLSEDGLFLFDVHSPYQMEHVFMDQTFTLSDEEVAYIWNCFPGDHPYSVEHELTFFVMDEQSGKYDRFDELHKQRTYSVKEYESWLNQAGFDILTITADFTEEAPVDASQRIFFTCKKN